MLKLGRYISLTPVHGPPQWTTKMDYPNGLSYGLPRKTNYMDYLKNYPKKNRKKYYPLIVCFDGYPPSCFHFVFITTAFETVVPKNKCHMYVMAEICLAYATL